MTNRETLRDVINDVKSAGGASQEQWNTILLTSIANSLAIIADALTDRKDDSNGKTITEYMKEKYDNREDKDNIFGVGITDAEFRKFAIDYLLGEDWYVVDSLGQTQVNEIALAEILSKYSKRFKKEIKPLRSIRRWE